MHTKLCSRLETRTCMDKSEWYTNWLTDQMTTHPTNQPSNQVVDWLTDWLTDSMKQNPSWKGVSSSVCPKISYILWDPKVYYQFHRSLRLFPFVSQMSPGHFLQFRKFLPFHATVVVSWALGWATQSCMGSCHLVSSQTISFAITLTNISEQKFINFAWIQVNVEFSGSCWDPKWPASWVL